jgi:hypothetical protein
MLEIADQTGKKFTQYRLKGCNKDISKEQMNGICKRLKDCIGVNSISLDAPTITSQACITSWNSSWQCQGCANHGQWCDWSNNNGWWKDRYSGIFPNMHSAHAELITHILPKNYGTKFTGNVFYLRKGIDDWDKKKDEINKLIKATLGSNYSCET